MLSWLLQRLSAIALLVMLFLHVTLSHFPPRDIDFDNVLTRLQYPGWKVFYIAFLAIVLYHALNGVWQVASDWSAVRRARRIVLGVTWIVGLIFLYLGAETIWRFDLVALMAK